MTIVKEQANRGTALMPGEERRRSQRVIIRVPVTLVVTENGQTVKISAHTVAVNIHGAMVVCPRTLEADTTLEVVNGRTDEKVASRVTRAPRDSSEGFLIPVEFTSPSPNFWQITFPPANWKAPE
ncbi:MAG TPA: PilZ domain-containing protein, partial [Verrucomicrobiae bacterium]|nr:PilZ domain-containing protein [Verrucomicrobiae bacterium]